MSVELGRPVVEFSTGLFLKPRTRTVAVWSNRCRSQSQAIQELYFVNAAVQVGSAWTNSIGEIYFISVFGTFAGMQDIGVYAKISTVIKHSNGTEHLLENSLSGFTVKMKQINCIFQITVSIFDTPAEMIKPFQLFRREIITGKIGHKAFI